MGIDKAVRRGIEKEDEERVGITGEEKDDYIDERIEYRNEYDKKLEKQITVDELTGLTNEKGFRDELEGILRSMRRTGDEHRSSDQLAPHEFALFFIDLDKFKRVNDTYGHPVGNTVLKKTAETILASVRDADVVARLHGDEFMVLLPRATQVVAERVASKILEDLNNDPDLKKYEVGASIGVRHIEKSNLTEQVTPDTLIKQADDQQMKAKQTGRGKFVTYSDS